MKVQYRGIRIPDLRKCILIAGCMSYEHMRGSMQATPHTLFSETVITIIIKLARITGTSYTKLRLFLHKVSSIISTLFPTLHEMLNAGQLKLFLEALGLITYAVFKLIIACKTASSECILQGPKRWKLEVLNWDSWEDKREQSPTPLLQLPL
jgi:hypothetical protein